MGEDKRESADFQTVYVLYLRGRKQNERKEWGTAVHEIKEGGA